MTGFTESVVEEAALAWIEALGYSVAHGPDFAFDGPSPERRDTSYGDTILEGRLRRVLVTLNADLPREAVEDAFES